MEGEKFTIGGREFVVPRMRVLTYERVMRAVEQLEKPVGEDSYGVERLNLLCGAMREILARNYPDLSADDVKDLVDVAEVDAVLSGLMVAAGRKAQPKGEAVGP